MRARSLRRPPAAPPCARWRSSPAPRSRSWTAASPPAARATRCCATTATCPCTTPAAAPPSRGWSTATRMPPSAATVPASSTCARRAPATSRSTPPAGASPPASATPVPPPLTARWAALLDRHLAWMAAAGTTTAEVKSGYGLDRDTELAMLDAAGAGHPIEVAPTFLGAHAVGPEWDDADDYLTFVIKQVMPQAAGPRRGRRRVPRARRLRPRSGRALPARRRRATGWPCGCTPTSSARRAASSSPSSWAPARSTTSRRPAPRASLRWRPATWRP